MCVSDPEIGLIWFLMPFAFLTRIVFVYPVSKQEEGRVDH